MKEKVLQEWIEQLVAAESLHEIIEGKDSVDPSTYFHKNENFIPSFPVDFLMRQRCLSAAEHVLGRLIMPEMVSTAATNLSLNRSERLFPDLLLCDMESGSLVLIEIKRSKSTERETATELLAYEHEIRNHYPFLSNLDICHVVIATEFSPLLDHSVAGLVTWNEKQVLCLKASGDEGAIRLEVHIPEVWTSIGQKPIPSESLVTVDLHLYQKSGESVVLPKEIERIADTALNLIARDGDRFNSHGFVMLWEDQQRRSEDLVHYCLTIGMINPYPFTVAAVAGEFIKESHTKLVEYVHRQLEESNICPFDSLLGKICHQAKSLLGEKLDPMWENFSTWESQRVPLMHLDAPMQGIQYRALPLKFEFWGVLGSFARQFITMPAVRGYFDRLISVKNLDWRDPQVAIELLDRLVGLEAVQHGRFPCSAIFKIGNQIASFLSINFTMEQVARAEGDFKNLPAMHMWYGTLLASSLREVLFRYNVTTEELPEPPVFERSENGYIEPESIISLVQWLQGEFLKKSRAHQRCFQIGTKVHGLLNPDFAMGTSMEEKAIITEELAEFGRWVLATSAKQFNESNAADDTLLLISKSLENRFGLKLRNGEFSIGDCQAISSEDIVPALDEILELIDQITFPLFHPISPVGTMKVDWNWLRQQAQEMRNAGKHPSLVILADGGYGIQDAGIIGSILVHDGEKQILFTIEAGGAVPLTLVTTWEDLVKGILPNGKPTKDSNLI